MPSRKFASNIKSLLHFDFPYYLENNDGLRDEVSSEKFTRNNVKFVGTEIPNDEIISGTPKFGYRCPSFSGQDSFISATNNTGIFTLSENGSYEFGFFLRVTALISGRILAIKNSAGSYPFALGVNSDGKFTLAGSTSTTEISLFTWTYILIRISGRKFYVYQNGTQILTGDFPGADCESLELGGFIGQIDEFIFKHGASSSTAAPNEPQKALCDINSFGGFGTGKHGSQNITTQDTKINSYGIIKSAAGKNLIINSWTNGAINNVSLAPGAGDEVMIHVTRSKGVEFSQTGKFAFRKIAAVNGLALTLDYEIDEFDLPSLLERYYVQVITVPNFIDLTIQSTGKIIPLRFQQTTGGGIVAFKCASGCQILGQIISFGYGPDRTDNLQLTHAGLIENFVLNYGGGIFIASKRFSTSSTARIGAAWDGSSKGGTSSRKNPGTNGGTGYGGGGGSDVWGYSQGGSGGVGGAGGGGNSQNDTGGDAGKPGAGTNGTIGKAGTGGGGGGGSYPNDGGIQGINSGGKANDTSSASGGGGAGGNGGACWAEASYQDGNPIRGGYAGSNVIILSEVFSCNESAISTGGEGGLSSWNASGGGGTGFCYIACKEMK